MCGDGDDDEQVPLAHIQPSPLTREIEQTFVKRPFAATISRIALTLAAPPTHSCRLDVRREVPHCSY